MANSTFVYFGLSPDAAKGELRVTGMSSPTGEGDNTSNLTPLGRAFVFDRVVLSDDVIVPGAQQGQSASRPSESAFPSFQRSVAGRSQTFDQVIRFGPDGTATVSANGVSRWIQIGLRPARSGQGDPNTAVIQISGLTGTVEVFRP